MENGTLPGLRLANDSGSAHGGVSLYYKLTAANRMVSIMAKKHTHEELVGRLETPGWEIVTGNDSFKIIGTLEKLLRTNHERRAADQSPGPIKEIETGIELDMLQIAKLWRYLGLPV